MSTSPWWAKKAGSWTDGFAPGASHRARFHQPFHLMEPVRRLLFRFQDRQLLRRGNHCVGCRARGGTALGSAGEASVTDAGERDGMALDSMACIQSPPGSAPLVACLRAQPPAAIDSVASRKMRKAPSTRSRFWLCLPRVRDPCQRPDHGVLLSHHGLDRVTRCPVGAQGDAVRIFLKGAERKNGGGHSARRCASPIFCDRARADPATLSRAGPDEPSAACRPAREAFAAGPRSLRSAPGSARPCTACG